ncbi:MAG: hypothetical protein ACR2PT_04385, partial [Endozoicomonas sp.]
MDPRIQRTGSSVPQSETTPPPAPEESHRASGLNRQIRETETHGRKLESRSEDLSHPLPRSEPIEDKEVTEVAPQTWFDYLRSKIGWGTVTTTKAETRLPPHPEHSSPGQAQGLGNRNVGAIGGFFETVGSFLSKGASAIGMAWNKGSSAFDSLVNNTISSGARSLISSKAGVDFDLNNEDWQSVLGLVMHSVVGSDSVPDYKDYVIPKLTKKNEDGLPLVARNITLNARPTPINLPSATVKDQQTIRSIDIRQLECDVELPRPGRPPLLLHVSLLNGKATIGTDLVKNLTNASAKELNDIISVGGRNTVLREDNTALQLSAEELSIDYDQLGTRVLPSKAQQSEKDTTCLTGFNNGKLTFHDFRLGHPVNILRRSSDQSTYASFSGFSVENSADLPTLVDVDSVDLKGLDKQNNGSFSCKLKLHPEQLVHNRALAFLVKGLFGKTVALDIDAPVIKGEMSFADLKKGISIRTTSRMIRWAVETVLAMPGTRVTCSESGQTQLQLSVSKDIMRYFPFIKRLAFIHRIPIIKRLSSFNLAVPLPLKGIMATQSQGKVVLSELLGGIGEKFKLLGDIGENLKTSDVLPGTLHLTTPELEEMALEASNGSLPHCLELLDRAQTLISEGHFNEAARALKAIPVEQYVAMIRQPDTSIRPLIHQAAHILAPMDSQKATQIYIELLRSLRPDDDFTEVNDARWLTSKAERIKPDTAENRILLCDVLEMACKLDPHAGALTQLARLTPDHYPATSLASLIGKLIHSGHFADPLVLTSTIEILEPRLGKAIIPLLEEYPIAPLVDLVKSRNLNSRTILNSLVQCFEKYGLSSMAADIHLELNEPAKARVILERAIDRGDCSAFARKIRSDLDQVSFDRTAAEQVARNLLLVLTGKKHSEDMQKTAQGLLIELWDKAHAMGIGSALLIKPATSSDASPISAMVTRLFTVTEQEYEDLSALDSVLDSLKEQLKPAETSESTALEEKALISVFRQLLSDLEERNSDALFQDAEDLTADEVEQSLEAVDETSVDLPPLSPTFLEFIPDTKAFVPGSITRMSSSPELNSPDFELTELEQNLFGSPSVQLPVTEISTSQSSNSEPEDDDDEYFDAEELTVAPFPAKPVTVTENPLLTESVGSHEETSAISREQLISSNAPTLPSL